MDNTNAGVLRRDINEVMRRAYACEIPLGWRSQERRTGAGGRKSHFRGAGDDYDGSRKYVPGDDARKIDWKAFAVSGGNELSIKTYKMNTEVTAYLLCDIAPSMDFGTERTTKRHLTAEVAACIIRSLDETQDRAGVHIYSDNKLERSLPTRGAKAVIYPAVAAVLGSQRSDGNSNSALAQVLSRLPHHRSLVYIISDFMNMTPQDWLSLNTVARHHDVLCVYVQDKRERELPTLSDEKGFVPWLMNLVGGFYEIQDWSGERRTIWLSKRNRAKYAEGFKEHEARVCAGFAEARCQWVVISTEEGDAGGRKIIRALGGVR